MRTCPACRADLPVDTRFCAHCGASVGVGALDDDATEITAPVTAPSTARATSLPPADADTRFVPGQLINERYRIVGLLGRGGMGEVYRADDLQLGQPVALKFLPTGLERDPDRLTRFRNEVRTALQITHANVCRVYDIGEVAGQHFLSMEYVDGEDLASLLRRVGRLPEERAVEVARQICAGLAAAHDRGILHRDLKPANIMVDGRGQVRLTDFGLAGLAESIDRAEVRAGTPAYMAPEQLAGEQVSVRSDIYALGLVLYELFTGQRTFRAETLAELQDLHASATPSRLSNHVADLDPAVERAVLHCLEKRPEDRPSSALVVSAALPGGDPLAAALAAGETPSPELVAESGSREAMRPGAALLLAVSALLLLVGVTRWAGTMSLAHYLPLDKRPEVLMDRAQSILPELGFTEPVYSDPVDHAWGMLVWGSIVGEVAAADSTATRWDGLRDRHDVATFWYRQSPRLLRPYPTSLPVFLRGGVDMTRPHPTNPGETSVLLDLAGRLRRLEIMPKRFSTVAGEIPEPNWARLFALAELDTARFTETQPRYQRFLAPDRRRAWRGTRAGAPNTTLWVEAGSFEGRPVLFNVATEASLGDLGDDPIPQRPTLGRILRDSSQPFLILVVVLFSIRLTRRNLKRSRADNRGAVRFAVLMFTLFVVGNALRSHLLLTHEWAGEIWPLLVGGTFIAVIAWGTYSAAEPLGRQVWPTMFVTSSRLLSRPQVQFRDPLIGQSVLVGLLTGGLIFAVTGPARRMLAALTSDAPPDLFGVNVALLHGPREALATYIDQSMMLVMAFLLVVALVVIQYFVKRRKLALAITLLVWTVLNGIGMQLDLVYGLFAAAVSLAVLLRWGVVAMVVGRITFAICWQARSGDWSAWHAEGALIGLAILGLLAFYGYWAATGSTRTYSP